MGLELVELVLQVEERFEIEVDDAAAAQINRVGELVDFVVCQRPELNYEEVSPQIKQIIMDLLRVKELEVHAQAHLIRDLGMG